MSRVKRLRGRVTAFFGKSTLDADLEAELASHLDMAIEENIERGMGPLEARRMALLRFGGMELAKYQHREARGLMKLDILLHDLRYTLRTLVRDPGFSVVAVLILALGIGANITVFSVVNTLLLRPLPFPQAQELVWIAPPPSGCGLSCATYSTDAYDQFRVATRSYQDVTGYFAFSSPGNLKLQLGNGAPVPATGIDVIHNFFNVLGVQPQMGRLFREEDGRNGAAPVVVLTDAWWRRQFNADPNIIGKAFDINGTQTTVVGVLPKSFDFGAVFAPGTKVDALTPLNLYGPPRSWGNIITMIGRMKPGVTLGQAVGEAAQAAKTMCWNLTRPETCGSYTGSVVPVPLKNYVTGRLHQALVVLWSAVGAILLIACVNLSNLMLARAASRSKEFAMRSALGAGRGRIVRQLLTESLVLSGAGAMLGLGLATILLTWLAHQGAVALPLLSTLHIDAAALAWTVLIAVFAAIFFGLVPGLKITSGNLQETLKDSGAGSGQSRKHERTRSILVVTEVALACMLLVGAGLLLRSFLKVLDVNLGFQPEHAAAITVDFTDDPALGNGSTKASLNAILAARDAHFQQLVQRASALPGVEAAGISDFLPMAGNRSWGLPWPKGVFAPDSVKKVAGPLVYVVSPGYLRAMGTRVRGRDLSWSDRRDTQAVVVIDEAMAKFLASYAHWPNNDPIGHVLDDGTKDGLLVVGVADDVHAVSVEGDNGWQIYYPMAQQGWGTPQLVVRTTLPPAQLTTGVMKVLQDANPKQTKAEFKPLKTLVDHSNSPRRFFMILVASFAGLGLLLAAIGIYGVISYSVTRQTQEIGIRMALGASSQMVERQILRSTLRLALFGLVIGGAASLGLGRLVATLLYGTSPWDGVTYAGMALLLLVVAALSGYVPARRAARISPLVALRTN